MTEVTRDNLEQLRQWRNNPMIRDFQTRNTLISEVEHEAWFRNISLDSNQMNFEIHLQEEDHSIGNLVGYCALLHINWINRVSDFGIYLDPDRTGRGYATDTMNVLLKYAFNTLNLNKVCSEVFLINENAMKLYDRLGFTREGILRQHHFHLGQYIDVVIVGILKNEFKPTS